MTLPIKSPYSPMEALSVEEVPVGAAWQYEPKWDGFRCLVFRDETVVELQSKSGRTLTRYFPEVVDTLRLLKPRKFVLDGEMVIPVDGGFSFDALLQRIHPAASRIKKLASETPAMLIVFDLLVDGQGHPLTGKPLLERRAALETLAKSAFRAANHMVLSPATTSFRDAIKWLTRVGNTLDGVIAKRRDMAYRSGKRDGMQKIKNYRSADCVVGGFRYHEGKKQVGSLLLGLYDSKGLLHHVGFTSAIKQSDKQELARKLEALVAPPGFTGNAPGGPSRWSTNRSDEWQPLRPDLVVEVCYDHFSGQRFRHGTTLLRWRPDKSPKQCTLSQVKQKKADIMKLLKMSTFHQ